jgi:predicted CXXCH cytochrome family protein
MFPKRTRQLFAAEPTPNHSLSILRFLFTLAILLGCGACYAKDTCFDCHKVMEGTSLKFTNDIHYARSISCADCHGGDPNEADQNISMSATRGFKLRVQRQGIPAFCGGCHSDTNFMARFKPEPRVDQLARYTNGVHGKLLAAGRKRAAECVDCHGDHDTRALSDPLSIASPQRISKTCAKCHAATAEVFANTQHGRRFNTARRPGCTVCHDAHATEPATAAMLTGSTSVCTKCHRSGSRQANLAEEMARYLKGLEEAGPESKEALVRARMAVHSMNLATVKRAGEAAPSSSRSAAE